MKPKQIFLIAVSIAIVVMGLAWLIWGFYFEEYEPTLAALTYALPCAPMVHEWTTGAHFLINPILSALSLKAPAIPVFGLWYCILTFIWLLTITNFLLRLLQNSVSTSKRHIAFVTCFVFLVFADSLVHFNLTRLSFFLVAGALLSVESGVAESRFSKICLLVVFTLGVLTRMSVATIVFGFLLLCFFLNNSSAKVLLKKYWLHASIIAVCVISFNIEAVLNRNFGKIMEMKFEYAITEDYLTRPLSEMTTALDSIKRDAVNDYFITDSANINEAFIKRVVKLQSHFLHIFYPENWALAIMQVGGFIKTLWPILFMQLAIIFIALFNEINKRKLAIKVSIIVAAFWLIVMTLTVSIAMFDRFLSPFLSVLTIIILWLCLPSLLKGGTKIIPTLLFLTLALVIGLYFPLKNFATQSSVQFNQSRNVLQEIQREKVNKTVIVLGIHRLLFSNKPLLRDNASLYNNLMFPDLANFSYYPFGKGKVIDQFGFSPLDYRAFCSYLSKNRDNVLILSPDRRIDLFKNYMHIVYGCEINVEVAAPIKEMRNWHFYRVKRDK